MTIFSSGVRQKYGTSGVCALPKLARRKKEAAHRGPIE